jgi:DNA-binding FrmR family transcriptional regulator
MVYVLAVQLYTINWTTYQLQWLLYSCIPSIEQCINYSDCCTAVYHQFNNVSTKFHFDEVICYTIGICCFSAKRLTLRSKNTDWLAWNQDYVFEWSVMSICTPLFQWASTINIQLIFLVQNKYHYHFIKMKLSWYVVQLMVYYQLQWLLYSCIPSIEQCINYSDCCTAVYHQLNNVSTTVIAVQLYTINWTTYQLSFILMKW